MDADEAVAPPPGSEHAPPPAGIEPPDAEERGAIAWVHHLEDAVPVLALLLMVALPLAEIVARRFGTGVPGSANFTQHLVLWVALLGAAVAARQGKLLALATTSFMRPGFRREAASSFAAAAGAAVSALLARASVEMVLVEKQAGTVIAAGVKAWVAQLALPIGFALIALRLVWLASPRWWARGVALAGLLVGIWLGQQPALLEGKPAWPGIVLLLVATALGSPIFAVLGGLAVLLFMHDGVPISAGPAEIYQLAVSQFLAAVPLFTLAGFLLAEGKSSLRLLAVFRALFGAISGGTAVVCALVCAFFTIFTGGSGVTILALGGLMLPALLAEGYPERFSLGLLTASGSLGLLWAPALPLILYGIVANVPIEQLFLGGLLPGLLMVGLNAAWGVRQGMRSGVSRHAFRPGALGRAVWEAKWELLLPVLVLGAFLGGFATLVETSAVAALYVMIVKTLIHRDIAIGRPLFRAFRDCVALVGGVMVIVCAAKGFSSYLTDAELPARGLTWVQANIHSPWLLLLGLNLLLLLVGSVMEVFAAIIVLVPLLKDFPAAYHINPVHLGIMFVANLELGYLTPPAGLNLFLASSRFQRPLLEVYRAALPYLVLNGIGVLLITYVPFLTTWLLPAAAQ
ncbi:MAG TPA: TRAP transporter large permease subunit [Thermoanaerobaculia bacterium]|jgi:tripartite ATP-independent transporter DctM subunit|nr:TRAP transporter large permease subunit [Thermoanaerobaculia bacterium]